MQIIDLSDTLQNDKHWAPWWARNSVTYQGHKFGSFAIWLLFGVTPKYLRNRLGWANEVIKLSTHGTTHMDAPVVELFGAQNGWQFEIIEDLGSGLNYSKKGLKGLIRLIVDSKVERLVLTHKDRLLRFGSELIFSLCEHFGTEVMIINRTEDSSFEEDLATDVLEIITVFSARLYGSRSHKNKKIVEELREVANRI